MNNRANPDNSIPDPHPCSIDQNSISNEKRDEFYESIANSCQRHACKLESGYCIKKKRRSMQIWFSNANKFTYTY